MRYECGDVSLAKRYRYSDVDLIALEQRYGRELLERVYFHIMAFEAIPLASLKPDSLCLGPLVRYHTAAFERAWRTVFLNVSGQWRFQNGLVHYRGPIFESGPCSDAGSPAQLDPGPLPVLNFTGGGKDSLVAMKLLERAGIAFSSFSYSHPAYGPAAGQHFLIDHLSDVTAVRLRHRLDIEDEFWEPPAAGLERRFGIRSRICGETPAAIMGAIPVALAHGYRYLALGHERSADSENLYWAAAGEPINHQWGKSLEAELLLDTYIRGHLLGGLSCFSLLKPIHDVVIFSLLSEDLDALERTHSCNVRKPWCRRCPKCAYVWLNFMAWLPEERVWPIFQENLFEAPENEIWFRGLLGLEAHRPFECVGEIAEARLAFALCRHKGLRGPIMDAVAASLPAAASPLDQYFRVHRSPDTIPDSIAAGVFPRMERAAERARDYVHRTATAAS